MRESGSYGGRWSKSDREGNELVIRYMQRGNSGVRWGAVSHEYQVKEVASLVGCGRGLQGEVKAVD